MFLEQGQHSCLLCVFLHGGRELYFHLYWGQDVFSLVLNLSSVATRSSKAHHRRPHQQEVTQEAWHGLQQHFTSVSVRVLVPLHVPVCRSLSQHDCIISVIIEECRRAAEDQRFVSSRAVKAVEIKVRQSAAQQEGPLAPGGETLES